MDTEKMAARIAGLIVEISCLRKCVQKLESEIASLRRERDDALRVAEIVRQLATPPISDADVEAAVAEARRVRQEIDGEH